MAGPSPGVAWGRLLICASAGAAIALLPPPGDLDPRGWGVFAVFVGVVLAFLLRPIDMAPAVLIGLLVIAVSGLVEVGPLIASGFGDKTVWLVVAAFLIADAVEHTGLGRRIALLILRALGRSLIGTGYAIAAAELVLAPFIPSNTARGGGVLSPVVNGLAKALGAVPGEPRGPGAYLSQVGSHSNLVTSAMFLTAMAGNALVLPGARDHLGVDFGYWRWIQGACVPGLASLSVVPLLLWALERPPPVDISSLRERVAAELSAMGRWTRNELVLGWLLLGLLLLWTTGRLLERALGIKLDTTATALIGVALIVVLNVRSWPSVASTWRAWDALLWLGGYVALAEALKSTRFTDWFASEVRTGLAGWSGLECALILALIYFASMVFFSQLTVHAAALSGAFLAVAASTGAPPLLAVGLIAYFTTLCGAMTPWSSGPVIIYFGLDYVPVGRWIRNGCLVALCHLGVWLTVGMAWWRWLGWWAPPTP